jgi:hypothetical protein
MTDRAGRTLHALIVLVLAVAVPAAAQELDFSVEAPAALEPASRRVRDIDRAALADALGRAGLPLPQQVRVLLVASDDPRALATPDWIVGRAAGTRDIVIFPERIGAYPYGSLESVVRHEIVHLALSTRARGAPLPRWFHEGVAVSVGSGWGARDEIRLLLAAFDRPSISQLRRLFTSDRHEETAQAYLLAGALVDEVRARHGSETPGSIAAEVASGLSFDAAFVKVTGERTDEVAARAWAGYRRLSRALPAVTSPSAVWVLVLGVAALAFAASLRRRRARRRQWEDEEARQWEDDGGDPHADAPDEPSNVR